MFLVRAHACEECTRRAVRGPAGLNPEDERSEVLAVHHPPGTTDSVRSGHDERISGAGDLNLGSIETTEPFASTIDQARSWAASIIRNRQSIGVTSSLGFGSYTRKQLLDVLSYCVGNGVDDEYHQIRFSTTNRHCSRVCLNSGCRSRVQWKPPQTATGQ